MNVGGSSRASDAAEATSCWACLYCEQTIRGESGGDGEPNTAESSLEGGGDGEADTEDSSWEGSGGGDGEADMKESS